MKGNLLTFSLLSAKPDYLSGGSAWIEHIPFAFLAVEALRPDIFVELGSHHGDSYVAFCQAAKTLELPMRAFAVDTWEGDPHAGFYGQEVYDRLKSVHDKPYGHFSEMKRMKFDDARNDFADGSIDLLHIDGLHTYEAVKHDFETWLPKMSERGVILFHDTVVRDRNFGVWKLWADISSQYNSFEFHHGHGLGILCVGKAVPQTFLDLLGQLQALPDNARSYFHAQGQQLSLQNYMRVLNQKNEASMQQSADQMDQAAGLLQDMDRQITQLKSELRESQALNAQLKQVLEMVTAKA
ncbi:hypothetical protein MF4836_15285 [Pseudomonas sp. MF4836]|nr:hypothetical protein MF4836_15285 [Pseudomonas sp. MF4836]